MVARGGLSPGAGRATICAAHPSHVAGSDVCPTSGPAAQVVRAADIKVDHVAGRTLSGTPETRTLKSAVDIEWPVN